MNTTWSLHATTVAPILPALEMESSPDHITSSQHVTTHKKRLNYEDYLRDIIIGFADGVTVPFALTAGLSSYVLSQLRLHTPIGQSSETNLADMTHGLAPSSLGSSRIVVLAGLAELFSGAISMGLGAWLAAQTEAQQYTAVRDRVGKRQACPEELYNVFEEYNLSRASLDPLVSEMSRDSETWTKVSGAAAVRYPFRTLLTLISECSSCWSSA